jgi:hypothetical protein
MDVNHQRDGYKPPKEWIKIIREIDKNKQSKGWISKGNQPMKGTIDTYR